MVSKSFEYLHHVKLNYKILCLLNHNFFFFEELWRKAKKSNYEYVTK